MATHLHYPSYKLSFDVMRLQPWRTTVNVKIVLPRSSYEDEIEAPAERLKLSLPKDEPRFTTSLPGAKMPEIFTLPA